MNFGEVIGTIIAVVWAFVTHNLLFFAYGISALVFAVLLIGAFTIDGIGRAWYYATTPREERAKRAEARREESQRRREARDAELKRKAKRAQVDHYAFHDAFSKEWEASRYETRSQTIARQEREGTRDRWRGIFD